MDLELLFRACWRHKLALLAAGLLGAIAAAGLGAALLKPKYASTSDLSTVPIFSATGNTPSIYVQNPDRYVATQVEVLSAQSAAADVAVQLKLKRAEVVDAVTVAQVGNSDVIRVTATTSNADTSARIAGGLVQNYLKAEASETRSEYDKQLASIDEQRATVAEQTSKVNVDIAAAGGNASAPAALQQRLTDLVTQDSTLVAARQAVLTQIQTQPSSAKLVSKAVVNPASIGLSTKSLALFGGALGMALAFSALAVASRPGRSLDDLAGAEEFDGVPLLGVVSTKQKLNIPLVPQSPPIEDLRNMAVADELSRLVQLKGAIQFVVVGNPADTRRTKKSLVPFVFGPSPETQLEHDGHRTARRRAEAGEFTVLSLATFLPGQFAPGHVVVGVDLGRVSRPQLDDVLSGLTGIGAEVLGIVGIR